MNRRELEHAVQCSVRYERMTATFNRRLDNAAIFLQIILGLAVLSDVASMKIVGAAVSIISIWVFVYRPGPKALLAAQQQRRYETLCVKMASLGDAELAKEFAKVGKRDSDLAGFIYKTAENAEHANNNSPPPHKRNPIEWALALIAGN